MPFTTAFRRLTYSHLSNSVEPTRRFLRRSWRRMTWPTPPATVLHITHYKAGSQWILRILQELAEPWIVPPRVNNEQFLGQPVKAGRVYPTLYLTRQQFEQTTLPREWRRFMVIRDLRDTLISAYFSLRVSHDALHPEMSQFRAMLDGQSTENALIKMIRQWCPPIAEMQRSWAGSSETILKYEALLSQDVELLAPVLLDHCKLPISPEHLRAVIVANRFQARSGRNPGEENIRSHERKGVAGDWRNHFTDKVAKEFQKHYGELLLATGYEENDRW